MAVRTSGHRRDRLDPHPEGRAGEAAGQAGISLRWAGGAGAREDTICLRARRPLPASSRELPALIEGQRAETSGPTADVGTWGNDLPAIARRSSTPRLRLAWMRPANDRARDDRRDSIDFEMLGQAVARMPGRGLPRRVAGPPAVLLATAADSGLDAGRALKAALESEGGRGGGNARLAQGSLGSQPRRSKRWFGPSPADPRRSSRGPQKATGQSRAVATLAILRRRRRRLYGVGDRAGGHVPLRRRDLVNAAPVVHERDHEHAIRPPEIAGQRGHILQCARLGMNDPAPHSARSRRSVPVPFAGSSMGKRLFPGSWG